MVAISAANNVLSFTPKANSYFFETFPCQAAASNGYNSLQFKIKGPAGGSIRLELQTQISCMVTTYTSSFLAVEGLTGGTQTVTVPLSAFVGANLNAISSVVWFGFSSNNPGWQLSQVQLGCAAAGGVSVVVPAPLASGAVIPKPALTSSAPFRPSSTSNPRAPAAPGSCSQDLIVDDFVSQSRLTFLYYNALLQPSSDDATMKSVVVADNRVTLTPANRESYWFTQVGCTDAKNIYGGISMRIKAPPGTVFTVELGYKRNCADEDIKTVDVPTTTLNWAFDGTEKLYSLKWSQFPGVDASKLNTLLFSGLNRAVTVGPIALYCGDWLSEYIAPYKPSERPTPVATVPAPAGTHAPLVIDQFTGNDANALGFWHGGDEGLEMTWGNKEVKLVANDPDYAFYTQFAAGCKDITEYEGSYLHIAYSGSNAFSIALQQHNSQCNEKIAPYPETWDEIEAARYASASDIYVPISHFKIEKRRAIGFAIKSWYKTAPTTLRKIEIVPSVPAGFAIPSKLPSGQLIFACKRPNSFAFCIDDGNPEYAQEIMKVIREENIKVTFFTVGARKLPQLAHLFLSFQHTSLTHLPQHSSTHPPISATSTATCSPKATKSRCTPTPTPSSKASPPPTPSTGNTTTTSR